MSGQVEMQYCKVGELTPYHQNPRINDDAVEYVRRSIENFQFLVPIVVDGSKVIITGHTRYMAAKELGLDEVPVIVADHLTEEQAKAYRLADNRVSEYASWDEGLLSRELQELQEMGFDLLDTGFSEEELDCLVEPITADCLDDLSHESVCGDVAQIAPKVSDHATLIIGPYFIRIHKQEFAQWEADMLKKYKSNSGVAAHIAKQLGLCKYMTERSKSFSVCAGGSEK